MKTDDKITMAHGGGGRLTRDLIEQEILSRFGDGPLKSLPDAALLPGNSSEIIFTTDSFVVQPLFFPGGNIGDLAVHGTVNDIAVSGGKPMWISLALIMEEGFPLGDLRRILDSVRKSVDACGVSVVTGDTKVVGRGQCDGIYINTAGIGSLISGFRLGREKVEPGDVLIASGTLAEHGMAVLAARKNIDIANGPESDTGPVHRLVAATAADAPHVRFMRDPTRGGLAAVLNELADDMPFNIMVDEAALPLSPRVKAVSEMLGIDPLHVASEGRLVMVCSPQASGLILAAWKRLPAGTGAAVIGKIVKGNGRVILNTLAGGTRLIDLPRGELLPRIC